MADERMSLRAFARRIGVSPSTVSRVLNDRPGVSDTLRRKVDEGVRQYGHPGGGGATPGSPFVGVIVPELDNPAFPAMASAIENALARHGITGLIGSATNLGVDERAYVDVLLRHGAHGFVLVSGWHAHLAQDHSWYGRTAARGVAMVLVSGLVEGLKVPSVGTDEGIGARLAVDYLASLGHRRIGLAGGEEHYRPSVNRLRGYREALARRGLEAHPHLYAESFYTLDGGRAAGRALIESGATAIIAGSDVMAVGVIEAARDAGRRVPEDLSVIGYDDGPLATFGQIGLTTLRQPIERIATAVAGSLAQQLRGIVPVALHQRFEPTLIVRESTAAAPG